MTDDDWKREALEATWDLNDWVGEGDSSAEVLVQLDAIAATLARNPELEDDMLGEALDAVLHRLGRSDLSKLVQEVTATALEFKYGDGFTEQEAKDVAGKLEDLKIELERWLDEDPDV